MLGTQCEYLLDGSKVGLTDFPLSSDKIKKSALKNRGMMEHSSIVFRRKHLNYDLFFYYAQDCDLYLRAMKKGRIENLNEVLVQCKVNLNGISFHRRILQEKFQRIAIARYKNINIPLKRPTESKGTKFLWHLCLPFYKKYLIESHLNKKSMKRKIYLILACLINYQLMLIYLENFNITLI